MTRAEMYNTLNEVSEKYFLCCAEVTCYQEAFEFMDELMGLFYLGKVDEEDLDICLEIIDRI